MKRKLLFVFIFFISIALLLSISVPWVKAMGKRPPKAEKQPEEFVSPEIEIITKPEANIKLLSPENQSSDPNMPVSPSEVLSATGGEMAGTVKDARVVDIQQALKNAGFEPGSVDGRMGPKTKKAVRDFQKANNLNADGVVGPKTWTKLKVYLQSTKSGSPN